MLPRAFFLTLHHINMQRVLQCCREPPGTKTIHSKQSPWANDRMDMEFGEFRANATSQMIKSLQLGSESDRWNTPTAPDILNIILFPAISAANNVQTDSGVCWLLLWVWWQRTFGIKCVRVHEVCFFFLSPPTTDITLSRLNIKPKAQWTSNRLHWCR